MGVSVNQEVPVELCITGEKYKGGEPGCRSWEEAVLNQEHKTTLKNKSEKRNEPDSDLCKRSRNRSGTSGCI